MSNVNIAVAYKFVDGAHFFVAANKEAAGLCAANTNLEIAWNEVALQLNALWAFNHGEKVNFQPVVPFETFKKALTGFELVAKGADQSGMITPAPVQPWMITEQISKQ
jgi:hypothetical protein